MSTPIEALAEIREVFRRRVSFDVEFAAEHRNSEIHLLSAISKLIEDPLNPSVQEALVYYGFMLYENVKGKVPVEGGSVPFTMYKAFRKDFQSAIKSLRMDNDQKLNMLRSKLRGKALETIQSIATGTIAYEKAWELPITATTMTES